ncbi:hypothetical protein [Natrinema halophilum]|uniref:hypothetical protein n=1 Tax=Natrinema halophilum TaxID=1699371 RepID=UPI001F229F23|nr:hypothetical protein [Natrinema halophilum]UHQ96029.1 hypothetical protein HYG82_01625 [Natrinema halophilum]
MTQQIDAAHNRVMLPGCPLAEPDDHDAFPTGDARRRIPTVRPRDGSVGRTTSASAFRMITDDRRRGNPKLAVIP